MKFFILSFLVDQLIAMKPEVHHCSLSEVSKKTDSYHSTTRRKRQTVPAVPESSLITTGFYFNGTDQTLKLTRPSNSIEQDRIALPVNPFTIELWVTPEGGQADPAVIVGE